MVLRRRGEAGAASGPDGWADRRNLLVGGAVLILSAMVVMAVAGGATRVFNPHDDFHAYLSFPVKMLEAGWLEGPCTANDG